MNASANGRISGTHDVSATRLWAGMLGGGVAWLAHLMIAYVASEFGCVGGLGKGKGSGFSPVAWMTLALSVAMLVAAALAAASAYRSLLRLQSLPNASDPAMRDGPMYAARVGGITSSLFAVAIVVQSIPILFYLYDC